MYCDVSVCVECKLVLVDEDSMKIVGFFLLIAGGFLVITALVMLPTVNARNMFVVAGMAVQILGFVLVVRSHLPKEEPR